MKYDLKRRINMAAFLRTVDLCDGTVIFESEDGDRLNLKSQLSKYLFLTLTPDERFLVASKISCQASDADRLSEYIVIPDTTQEGNV